ncbi:MAG TPA: transglutaminase N-terminal domain-containing protein, partial [Flavisolibacter sp.]|nr:transglutaminase N-terminal domain-containing protein [Flavisolibacter sp.]
MPVFKIQHITRYEYDEFVRESVNEIRILPYQCNDQEVLQQNLTITGHPPVHTFSDYWGNHTGTFNLITPHQKLEITSKLIVRTISPSELQLNHEGSFTELKQDINGQLHMLELVKP